MRGCQPREGGTSVFRGASLDRERLHVLEHVREILERLGNIRGLLNETFEKGGRLSVNLNKNALLPKMHPSVVLEIQQAVLTWVQSTSSLGSRPGSARYAPITYEPLRGGFMPDEVSDKLQTLNKLRLLHIDIV